MPVTNATMIFGDSGTGKSSLLATIAEWVWRQHQKVTLLYSTDTGGYPSKIDALVRAGIIRVWKLRTRGEAFESCSRACQGFWPVEFTDPVGGETPPGVNLIPPVATEYTLHCKKCETGVKSSRSRGAFQQTFTCPKCANKVNLQNGEVTNQTIVHEFFKDVGLRMFDGLTAQNDWIMSDMAEKTGRGEIKGETAMGRIQSGEMTFGGSTRNHYGFAQTRSLNWIQDAANIPGHVIGPIFTARKQRATDSYNVKIYGPQIAGQAKTSDVPAWVANCLGASIFHDEKGRREFRLYLVNYKEPGDDVLHLCKVRTDPGELPPYLSDGPLGIDDKPASGEKAFSTFNLGHLMDLIEDATNKTLKETLEAYPDAPGLAYVEKMKDYAVQEEDLPPEESKVATEPLASVPKGRPVPKAPGERPKPPGRPQLKRPGPRPGNK